MDGFETFFTSWPQYVATCAVVVLAESVYVLFGFGSGLIAVGGLALLVPNMQDIVILLLLVNLPVEIFVIAKSYRQIRWRGVALIVSGIAVGVPIGTAILKIGRPTSMLGVLAVFLIVAGAAFLVFEKRRGKRWPAWAVPPVGLAGGLLGGMFGTGGPPLVLYYQLIGAPKAVFRGDLMAIFLVVTAIRVPSSVAAGLITFPRLGAAVAVLPAVLLGAWIGNRVHVQMNERTFRRMVSVLLVLVGGLLLFSSAA